MNLGNRYLCLCLARWDRLGIIRGLQCYGTGSFWDIGDLFVRNLSVVVYLGSFYETIGAEPSAFCNGNCFSRNPGRFGLVGSDRAHIISVGSDMVVVGFLSVGFRSGFGRN